MFVNMNRCNIETCFQMICDTRTTSVFKLKPIWAQISRSDWCLGASRCGGNALSRDGLLRSTAGWWGQQYHGDPWCIFWYESHICPFVTRGNHAIPQNALRGHNAWKMGWYLQTLATPSVMTSREPDPIWEGGISSLTMGFPVLATAIIPRNTTFSLSLNARGTCAKSVWSSLMRSICSDRCPYMKHRWTMFLQLFFLICLLFVCFFFFVPINIGIMMNLRYMRYYIDGSIPTTTLLLVKGQGVDQCGGWMWTCVSKFDSTIRLCHIDSFRSTMLYYMLCYYNIYYNILTYIIEYHIRLVYIYDIILSHIIIQYMLHKTALHARTADLS